MIHRNAFQRVVGFVNAFVDNRNEFSHNGQDFFVFWFHLYQLVYGGKYFYDSHALFGNHRSVTKKLMIMGEMSFDFVTRCLDHVSDHSQPVSLFKLT